MTPKTVLVTGGAGYIGSHACVELLNAGYELSILDNFSNSEPEMLTRVKQITNRSFKTFNADLRDEKALDNLFAASRIDAVIHFAALKAVGESVLHPLKYYETNVTGTINLLKAMQKADCCKIVFSSSATVYGLNNPSPYLEDYPLNAVNPYGSTKVMAERILLDLAASDPRWSIVLLRYFNPIGAHPSGLIGEKPSGIPNNIMPYITAVASGRLPELKIFGGDYQTADGTGVRDYIHVVDIAKGHLAALEYAFLHTGAEAFNLGTGKGTSVLELVHAFEQASGCSIPYKITSRRQGDLAAYYADTNKANLHLGWQAQHSLINMCKDAWRFEQLGHWL